MSLFFKTRTGQTPVDPDILKELKLTHVQNMSELYEHEEQNIALGIAWAMGTAKSHTDYMVWLEIHKHMLNDIWKFAGKIRTTELANTDFHSSYNVRPALRELERDLITWLEHKTYRPEEMMAIFHEKLLTIHPFRDGNGRWSRVVTEFVCRRERFPVPHWGKGIADDEERRRSYIAAVMKARHDCVIDDLADLMFNL